MSKHKFYNIKAASATEVDIYIYGLIGYGWWDEANRDALEFVSEFKTLEEKYNRINIRINSPGGLIDEGLPIFNAINTSKTETHAYIDGIAYSMGAIIALAADKVHAAKNSLMLLHNASGIAWGNAQDMRDTADMLDKYDSALITSLCDKTGKTEDEIRSEWMDYKDHLFTAAEAKQAGLVDIIEDKEGDVPENITDMDIAKVVALYAKKNEMPEDGIMTKIMNFLKGKDIENSNSPDNKQTNIMEQLQTIATALALEGENPTAEQIVEAINGLNTQVTDLNTQITTATDSTENLSTVITALDELEPTIADAEDQQAKLNALEAYLDNLRNEDADAATTAQKEKDQIDANADPTDQFEHNKAADSFL